MEETKNDLTPTQGSPESGACASGDDRCVSRRRLLRQGASVVVVTLASRPVLAWHCKSPSAWGSEQINPNTSLATNPGHNSYPDETWTISNWANNTSRNGFGQPWVRLKERYSSLYDSTTTSYSNGQKYFDYTKVTVKKLFSTVPIARPAGLADTAKVKTILAGGGTDLQRYTIVAQLNYILLGPLASPNDLDKCVTLLDLKKMASGSYTPNSMPDVLWGPFEITNYLYSNWIVRP